MEQNKQNATPEESKETQKPGMAHRLGDAIEKIGDKVEHAGFKKVGDAIEKLGDKIEHAQDSDTHEPTKIGLKN